MFLAEIRGTKIHLRPYQPSDISAWQRWDVDPEVQRHMPGSLNAPVSDEKQLEYLKECEGERDGVYWSVASNGGDVLIGSVAITGISDGAGELGVVIGEKDYWGKGIALEAVTLACGAALRELNLKSVFAEYEEGNVGAQKALEKAGFVREAFLEGSRDKDGLKINTFKYVLTNKLQNSD